jgi:hypothetical protein
MMTNLFLLLLIIPITTKTVNLYDFEKDDVFRLEPLVGVGPKGATDAFDRSCYVPLILIPVN